MFDVYKAVNLVCNDVNFRFFDYIFDFWPIFRLFFTHKNLTTFSIFFTKFSIFDKNLLTLKFWTFWPTFRFLQNVIYGSRFSIVFLQTIAWCLQGCQFLTKFFDNIYLQNFQYLTKFSIFSRIILFVLWIAIFIIFSSTYSSIYLMFWGLSICFLMTQIFDF